MVARYQTTRATAANFADNLCRWQPGSPHYEVWFLTLNERKTGRGFWFRYVLEAPLGTSGVVEPSAALWATVFDRATPEKNFGVIQHYEIERFAFEGREDFNLMIGDGQLSPSQAAGRVVDTSHTISWNLNFEPNRETYHTLSPRLTRLLRPASFVCSPNPDVRFSGSVLIDGQETVLDGEPGCQSHLWGSKRPDDWVWVRSNAFEGHPGTVFEGLAVRARKAGRTLPPLLSLFLRHRGEEHRFLRVRVREQWRRNLGIGFWTLSAMNARLYIEGAAQCRLRDMLQVEYRDPDGEPLYCINSEVANLKIRLFRRIHGVRWRHVETIAARATAHLEHASRSTDANVRMAF